MAEYIATANQTVATNNNVIFTDTVVPSCPAITHRDDSGLINLRGLTTTQCRARFRAYFSGNIAVPTGGTVGPISLSLAIDGEPLASTTMIVTPAAVTEYFNVSSSTFIDVPRGSNFTVSVRNTSTEAINVQNANLIVERVA